MIGKWVYENGKILGQIQDYGFQPAFVAYRPDGSADVLILPFTQLTIEEYQTGRIFYQDAEGLTMRLTAESEKE